MSIDTVFKITLILKEITMSSEDQMVLENIDEFVNDEGKIVSCSIICVYFVSFYTKTDRESKKFTKEKTLKCVRNMNKNKFVRVIISPNFKLLYFKSKLLYIEGFIICM